jgi:hypothetical protein
VPVRIATVLALVALGWQFARGLGRAAGPTLFRRMDPGTAGTVGFIVRFFTIVVAVLVALRVAGLDPRSTRSRQRLGGPRRRSGRAAIGRGSALVGLPNGHLASDLVAAHALGKAR